MAEIYYHPFAEKPGLLLLDYFATEAMKAFITNNGTVEEYNLADQNVNNDKLSTASYELAGRMLEAREKYLRDK